MPSLAAHLRPRVRGAVFDQPDVCERHAHDFGGVVRKRPRVVVEPADAEDVARVFAVARAAGVSVSTRSAGHSLSGQSLSDAGILLDMRALHRAPHVDRAAQWFDAEPGVLWRDVVVASLAHGLTPPVLTGTLRTTVGGTHSVGGMGHASFLHGTQVDQCIGLELVTPDGEVRWCSDSQHPELFAYALAGLGQLGVITRLRGRLRPAPREITSAHLLYTRRDRMLADLRTAAARGTCAGVGGYGHRHRDGWYYSLELTAGGRAGDAWLAGLSPDRVLTRGVCDYRDHVLRADASSGGDARNLAAPGANPWVDALLPAELAERYFDEVLRLLPRWLQRASTLLAWPLDGTRFTRPLFRAPDTARQVLASVFPTVTRETLADAVAVMTRVSELAVAMGGVRYLYGWVEMTAEAWAAHYGPVWGTLCRLRTRHDPHGLLNPGVVRYADPRGPQCTVAPGTGTALAVP